MTDFDPYAAVDAVVSRKSEREREEEARFQAEQRAKLQLPTELDTRAQLGARMVELAHVALADGHDDFECSRLAEGYALQGDYRQAAALTKDDAKRAEYDRIIAAVDNPQDCGCPKKSGANSTLFLQDRILFDGQIKNILMCTICRKIRC